MQKIKGIVEGNCNKGIKDSKATKRGITVPIWIGISIGKL